MFIATLEALLTDTLNKLDISNLEKIKESFEKILSRIKFVS
ncbi:hypothetical protein QIA34_04840 [Borreliella yangtzensis]|uniref:Uncharacterized protein n=1 Tax=Borreliella yangtzensis TaxID=683292 RepID=A0ABR6P976_9SPIR|nr:hypothetical protein [Borreliella yangtzensis]MBB6042828.1 hypothetical protein [Borreliella yangtzensis]WKC73784.1 hypothetical protein QIA35_04845 [Borreliella yangtzensis]WKC74701.1 hypothetical protein QIA34_04840 [Borreliella yangtzensis]